MLRSLPNAFSKSFAKSEFVFRCARAEDDSFVMLVWQGVKDMVGGGVLQGIVIVG